MKKVFLVFLSFMFITCLAGCGNKNNQTKFSKLGGNYYIRTYNNNLYLNELKTNIIEEKKDFVEVLETYDPVISSYNGLPISFIFNNSDFKFYCTTNKGSFKYHENDKNTTIQGNDYISWYRDIGEELTDHVYIDIIVKKNNINYGYCIISIGKSDNFTISGVYNVSVIKSVYFPEINGKKQNITDSDIQSLIYQSIYGI